MTEVRNAYEKYTEICLWSKNKFIERLKTKVFIHCFNRKKNDKRNIKLREETFKI